MDKVDLFFVSFIAILLTATGFIYGVSYQQHKEEDKLTEFYKQSCIALPHQTSVMKWVDGSPQCTRTEYIKGSTNLKDWKNERN